MSFAAPFWLLLFLLLPLLWLKRQNSGNAALRLPEIGKGHVNWRTRLHKIRFPMRLLAMGLLVLALARPQRHWVEEQVKADAIDIMLALDVSNSMLSLDFEPNRLVVAKKVLIDFIDNRPFDRIGLVAFAGEAFTRCPLTLDRRILKQFTETLAVGRLNQYTAVGMGLATAVNRLNNSESKSKVVILVTDGESNTGFISPIQAADLAAEQGIKVYTVGIGTDGYVLSPTQQMADGTYEYAPRISHFDTQLLQEMAEKTGGRFYRAYSAEDMQAIYGEIDKLEKTKIEFNTVQHHIELGPWLILLGLALLVLEFLFHRTVLRSITEF